MTAAWVLCDETTGAVVSQSRGSTEQLAALQAAYPGRVVAVPDDGATRFDQYLTGGTLAARPTHAAPSTTAPAVNATVTWPGIAAGAWVVISGDATDGTQHAGGDLELAFDTSGTYRVAIAGPGAYMTREDVIHVG